MTDIVERLLFKTELKTPEDVHVLFADAAAEIELMRHAMECVVLYWDEWKDAPADHPTALSLEEVADMCRAHLGEKK